MSTPLEATIETSPGGTTPAELSLTLRVTNPSEETVAVSNPDLGVPSPEMNWPLSDDAYQTSLLLSYGKLELTLQNEQGEELPRDDVATWATPVTRPPLELYVGDSFEIRIPIGAFYQLESGQIYTVTVTYGDQGSTVTARSEIPTP